MSEDIKVEETVNEHGEKIHYEPHPVTSERKKELRQKGFKIIDERFAPDYLDRLAARKVEADKSAAAQAKTKG